MILSSQTNECLQLVQAPTRLLVSVRTNHNQILRISQRCFDPGREVTGDLQLLLISEYSVDARLPRQRANSTRNAEVLQALLNLSCNRSVPRCSPIRDKSVVFLLPHTITALNIGSLFYSNSYSCDLQAETFYGGLFNRILSLF